MEDVKRILVVSRILSTAEKLFITGFPLPDNMEQNCTYFMQSIIPSAFRDGICRYHRWQKSIRGFSAKQGRNSLQ